MLGGTCFQARLVLNATWAGLAKGLQRQNSQDNLEAVFTTTCVICRRQDGRKLLSAILRWFPSYTHWSATSKTKYLRSASGVDTGISQKRWTENLLRGMSADLCGCRRITQFIIWASSVSKSKASLTLKRWLRWCALSRGMLLDVSPCAKPYWNIWNCRTTTPCVLSCINMGPRVRWIWWFQTHYLLYAVLRCSISSWRATYTMYSPSLVLLNSS